MAPRSTLRVSFARLVFSFVLFGLASLRPSLVEAQSDTAFSNRTIVCGWAKGQAPSAPSTAVGVLRDLPFSSQRGFGYSGGKAMSVPRHAVAPQSEWPACWREGTDLKYVMRVPNGRYRVDLSFVETQVARTGARVFDILLEERVAIAGCDIFAEAGDFRWLRRSVNVDVSDGWLDLTFSSSTPARPPRISRVSVSSVKAASSTETPTLKGLAGVEENRLFWNDDSSAVAWGAFRSLSNEGPYESLTKAPLRVPEFRDANVEAGTSYFYKVRSYGFDGSQSGLSAAVELRAKAADDLASLRRYDVQLLPSSRASFYDASSDIDLSKGEVSVLGQVLPTELTSNWMPGVWHKQKDVLLDMTLDTFRLFGKRSKVLLSAAAPDFTVLRDRLFSEAGRIIGITVPLIEPVLLSVDHGPPRLRLDSERLGSKFRKRVRIDREGVLIRLREFDAWREGWTPYGDRVGKSGDVGAFNLFVQQLQRVEEARSADFLDEHLYVDRWIKKLAFAAVRGVLDPSADSFFMLRDSRNGKWEFFSESTSSGEWGVQDFSLEPVEYTEERADRLLYPLCQKRGMPRRDAFLTLLTRFFADPGIEARYLAEVEAMLSGHLSPENFDVLVDRLHLEIREAVVADGDRWPFDLGASFLKGPAHLKASHRARVTALKAAIARAKTRQKPSIRFHETLLKPTTGKPWVSVKNVSTAPVDLALYRLSESLERAGGNLAAAGTLQPGATVRLALSNQRAHRESGGIFALWRRPKTASSTPILEDFVFTGHQTSDVSMRRSGDGAWQFLRDDAVFDSSPTYSYIHGVEESRDGALTIWFKPLGTNRSRKSITDVGVRYRTEGATDEFAHVPLRWDPETYRFMVRLDRDASVRTGYYFLLRDLQKLERAYPLGAPRHLLYLPSLPPLEITEVCPRPGPSGELSEFIEIHNPTDEPVSMAGMYLSDNRRVPGKWRIPPGVVVPGKGYVVFSADGLDRELHTSFKLSNTGEFLGLFSASHEGLLLIDRVAFRGVPVGQSWGRKQDGTRSFRIWKDPTPGKRNLPKIPDEFRRRARTREQSGQ